MRHRRNSIESEKREREREEIVCISNDWMGGSSGDNFCRFDFSRAAGNLSKCGMFPIAPQDIFSSGRKIAATTVLCMLPPTAQPLLHLPTY